MARRGDGAQSAAARWAPLAVAVAAALAVAALAIRSPLGVHPDEELHGRAVAFYVDHLLPPSPADPAVLPSLDPLYGVSYLFSRPPEVVYLLLGRLRAAALALGGADPRWVRAGQVSLLALLLALAATRRRLDGAVWLALLASGPLLYVFAYVNGDAFPLALSLALAVLLGHEDRAAPRSRDDAEPDGGGTVAPAALVGLLLGLLLLAKANYLPFVLFVAAFAAWQCWYAASRRAVLRRWLRVAVVAAAVAAPPVLYDLAHSGAHKVDAALALREAHATPGFRPGDVARGTAFYGLWLRQRGVPLSRLFATYGWHRLTAESFLGRFGKQLAVRAPALFFQLEALFWTIVLVAALAFVARRGVPGAALILAAAGLAMLITLAASLRYSWGYDLQPQGRYLFAWVPIALLGWRAATGASRAPWMPVAALVGGLLSLVSLVAVALPGLAP